jgi:DNA-binding SARP family transcriptional activator/tetratricopeptide (TPR) repeat protein
MLRLTTLGALRVQADDGALGNAAGQRRPLALLAVVAAAGGHGISRDKLLSLFWPDSDTDSARNSLRQALFTLRRELRCEALFLGSSDLRLNPETVRSDIQDFIDAIASGDFALAVRAYEGPFLDGVHVDGAPDFDHWAEAERSRLRACYQQALESLAHAASDRGDSAAAAEWWRKRAVSEPLNSRVAIALVLALAEAGDRAGALQAAVVHERLLREELDVAPPSELSEAVENVRANRLPMVLARHERTNGAGLVAPPFSIPTRRITRRMRVAALLLVCAATISAARLLWRSRHAAPPLPRNSIAVLPFDTRGADQSLHYLHEGMVDLLTPELTAGTAEHPASPQAVLGPSPAVDSEAVAEPLEQLAARLGVTRVVTGEVVGTPNRLVLRAHVVHVASGRAESEATVTGPIDSLASLADRLAAQLIAGIGQSPPARASLLASAPLPALKAYVQGQAAYRSGHVEEAIRQFEAALAYDSTFAYAAMGMAEASTGDAAGYAGVLTRAVRLGWMARDHLAPADRAYLVALAGPRFPEFSSLADFYGAWQQATAAAPGYPETWFGLGDQYFHGGRVLGFPHPTASAKVAFQRALELDPDFTPAIEHLLATAIRERDTAAVRKLGARYLRFDSSGAMAQFVRWRIARALRDDATADRLVAAFDTMPMLMLRWVVEIAPYEGLAVGDAVRAVAARRRAGGTLAERIETALARHSLALNRGRPLEASTVALELAELEPDDYLNLRFPVLAAMYGDGDSVSAAAAAKEMGRHFMIETAVDPSASSSARDDAREALCVLAQWRQAADPAFARQVSVVLRQAVPKSHSQSEMLFCSILLDQSHRSGSPARLAQLDTLDSLVRTGENLRRAILYAPLAVARLYRASGRDEQALAAVRRRGYFGRWPYYLSTMLREESDYALSVADTAGAICALTQYQALHPDPEPAAVPVVKRSAALLATLAARRQPAACIQ